MATPTYVTATEIRKRLAENYHIGTSTLAGLIGHASNKDHNHLYKLVFGTDAFVDPARDKEAFEHFRCFAELLSNFSDQEFKELNILEEMYFW